MINSITTPAQMPSTHNLQINNPYPFHFIYRLYQELLDADREKALERLS
ncbi:MAG: hypothetical protein HN368_23955 [Spirochaetales bacterium]|nr:hypothetical protein [Spirochaetales bacterium]